MLFLDGFGGLAQSRDFSVQAILNTLLPLFLIIALGSALQRGRFFGEGFVAGMNRLSYWVGLPALIFVSLATAAHGEARPVGLLAVLLTGTSLVALASWGVAVMMKQASWQWGTFVQAAFRGNLVYVGLPVLFALKEAVPQTAAILVLSPVLVLYNVISVVALCASHPERRAAEWRIFVREVAKNPIIWASIVGGVFYAANWPVWEPLLRGLQLIKGMAVPLALLCIGATLVSTPLRGNRRAALATGLLKTGLSPLVGLALGWMFRLPPDELRVVLILMACPTAAASYTMVRELGGDEALAATSVVLGTLLSALSLALVVGLA